MGRYDFSCVASSEQAWINDTQKCIRVHCYWKNNGWTYHMQPVYGWVTCNGEERCVYNAGYPDFTSNNQAQYELGYSDFTFNRGHSGYDVGCSARLRSDSSYASGERSASASAQNIPAKTHTVITYNANGGTGAPGNQDKWVGESLYLSSTKPTRTGYTFSYWSCSGGGNYSPGQQYTPDPGGTITMTAQWTEITYTVSYNANGGSGAPSAQTKRYTTNLTLSSTKPTRTGYNFKGWATSSTGAVAYQPGGTYSNNSAVTLYAVWELAYKKPTISNLTAIRCDSAGTASDSGKYVKVAFNWTTFNNMTKIDCRYKKQTDTTWSSWTNIKGSATGTSGSISAVTGSNTIDNASSYDVQVRVSDDSNAAADKTTESSILAIGTQQFPIDVKKGGKGVAFGKVAERDNAVDIGGSMNQLWLGGIKVLWYE